MAAKLGRPKGSGIVVTEQKAKEILAVLSFGGSIRDAADYTGISHQSILRAMERDTAFADQVKKAEATGKIKHLRRIGESDAWQASAWFLERKYPDEYARREPASKEAAQEIVAALAEFAKRGP